MKQLFSRMGRLFKKPSKKKLTLGIVGALVLTPALTWGGMVLNTKIAEAKMARDCDNNAIMECGAVNTKEFVQKYKTNKPGDLDNIYASAGLSASELNRFSRTAKMGYVTKSGNVVLDGKVVATDATTLGRQFISGSHTKMINGKKYYERAPKVSFRSDSIPAMIMMNGDQVEFVALTSCGNPVWNKPKGKPPVYKCDLLNKEAVAGKNDTFNFSAKATAQNGAKISKVVYNFGDGSKEVTKVSPTEKVTHTYKPGKYTARVTVHFTVNGETKTHTSESCTKPVEVKAPPAPVYACSALTAQLVPGSKQKYTFTAKAKAENGAVAKTADFDFGDGQKQNGVVITNNTATTQHEYAKEGTFTASVVLTFNVGSTTKTANCQVTVKPVVPQQPVYQCVGLAVAQKSRTDFTFKASGSAQNATITGYRYTIRNEAGQVLLTKDLGANENLDYTQTTAGAYTASGQVIVSVGNETKVTPETDACRKPFEVKPEEVTPVAECTKLTAVLKTGTKNTYEYAVSTKIEGNAKVVNYIFDYGDEQKQTTTGPTAIHTYAKDGEYKSKVTVTFDVNGEQVQKTSAACEVATPVVPTPPEECKPGIPVGDIRCTEKPEECKPGIPVGDARCQEYCKPGVPMGDARCEEQPKELPATGTTSIFASAAGLSVVAGAGYYFKDNRHKLREYLRRK